MTLSEKIRNVKRNTAGRSIREELEAWAKEADELEAMISLDSAALRNARVRLRAAMDTNDWPKSNALINEALVLLETLPDHRARSVLPLASVETSETGEFRIDEAAERAGHAQRSVGDYSASDDVAEYLRREEDSGPELKLPADPIQYYIERVERILMEESAELPVPMAQRTAVLAALYQAQQLKRIADILQVIAK